MIAVFVGAWKILLGISAGATAVGGSMLLKAKVVSALGTARKMAERVVGIFSRVRIGIGSIIAKRTDKVMSALVYRRFSVFVRSYSYISAFGALLGAGTLKAMHGSPAPISALAEKRMSAVNLLAHGSVRLAKLIFTLGTGVAMPLRTVVCQNKAVRR